MKEISPQTETRRDATRRRVEEHRASPRLASPRTEARLDRSSTQTQTVTRPERRPRQSASYKQLVSQTQTKTSVIGTPAHRLLHVAPSNTSHERLDKRYR